MGNASTTAQIPDNRKLVCCEFLRNRCPHQRSPAACAYLHYENPKWSRPCNLGEKCPHQHWKRRWTPDGPKCARCKKAFGLFTRCHHCRDCGSCDCASCLRVVEPIGKVCGQCPMPSRPSQPPAASPAVSAAASPSANALGQQQQQQQQQQQPQPQAPQQQSQEYIKKLMSSPYVVVPPRAGTVSTASVPPRFAASPPGSPRPSAGRDEYSKGLAAKLRELSGATSSSTSPPPSLPPVVIPGNPTAPLFTDPAKHRGSSTFKNIAEWLFVLPALEAGAVPDVKARTPLGAVHDASDVQDHWQSQIAFWLEIIADELENPGSASYVATISQRLRGKPIISDPIAAAKGVQERLHAAVDALHALGVDPAVAADELASVLLYTSDLGFLPGSNNVKCSIFAVANLLLRTCRAAGDKPDSDAQKLLAVYAPFIVRTDTFLARMPKQRRTLFRGVGFDFAMQNYAAGKLVSWGQFNSTTTDVEVAQSFSAGKTLFVLHAGSTAQVDFASVFPEEAETLLPSSSVFTSLGVTSPGLMRLLGQHGNLVQLRELGDDPTPQQVVAGMEEAKHALATLSDTFTESYVEARISLAPPPLPDDAPCLMLFQDLLPRFLECSGEFSQPQQKHLALLAAGGTGKTSTLLALHTHISRNEHRKQLQQRSKPVISIFVALPKLPGNIQDGKCIDAQVLAELGARDLATAKAIAAKATIVVLLDSLDECTIHGDPKSWKPLLDVVPFVRDHCRVIVSSRPEFAERLPSSAPSFVFGSTCQQMHVLPLTAAAHDTFISKFVASRNKELEAHAKIHKNSKFTLFQVAEPDVRSALDKLQLSEDDQRLPVVLTMALEVALFDVRHPNISSNNASSGAAAAAATSSSSSAPYCPPPGTRSHVMHRFLESRRTVILPNATEHTIDAAAFSNASAALMGVALAMLDRGDWNVTLGNVRSQILTTVPAANNNESDNDRALRVLGWHVPCRVESIHDDSSLFGFWHKSLGEYLCARALFLDTTVTTTKKLTTAFSLREPNVCWFFNDLCLGDSDRRLDITAGPLYDIVRNSASSPAAVSNAFALIGCSAESVDGWDFSDIRVSDCNLQGADLSLGNFDNAEFTKCNLRNTRFDFCRVDSALFEDNQYSSALPPIGHDGGVCAMSVLPGHLDDMLLIAHLCGNVGLVPAMGPDAGRVEWCDDRADSRIFAVAVCGETSPGEWLVALRLHFKVVIVNLASGSFRHTITLRERIKSIATQGSRIVTLVDRGTDDIEVVEFWSATTGAKQLEIVRTEEGGAGLYRCNDVVFAGQRWLVTGGGNREYDMDYPSSLCVWNSATGQQAAEKDGLFVKLLACAPMINDAGDWLVVDGGRTEIRFWRVRELDGALSFAHTLLLPAEIAIQALEFSHDGALLAVGSKIGVALVDCRSYIELARFSSPSVNHLGFIGDRIVSSGFGDRFIRFWQFSSTCNRAVQRQHGPGAKVSAADASPDGRHVAVASADKSVSLFESESGRLMWRNQYARLAFVVRFSPCSTFVVFDGADMYGAGLHCVDVADGSERWCIESLTGRVESIAVSPDSRRIFVGGSRYKASDPGIFIVNAADGADLHSEFFDHSSVQAMSLLGGQRIVSSCEDCELRVHSAENGAILHSLERGDGKNKCVNRIACAPRSLMIATADNEGSLALWQAEADSTVAPRRVRSWVSGCVTPAAISFSRDEQLLLCARGHNYDPRARYEARGPGAVDGDIVIWRTADATLHSIVRGHSSFVTAAVFSQSPSGRTVIVSGSEDKSVRITQLEEQEPGSSSSSNSSAQCGRRQDRGVIALRWPNRGDSFHRCIGGMADGTDEMATFLYEEGAEAENEDENE